MMDNLKQLAGNVRPIINKLIDLRVFVFILLFLGIYSFLTIRVNNLVQLEPAASALDSKQTSTKLTIDQNSIDQINQLQAQNVQVHSLFEAARNNPFTE